MKIHFFGASVTAQGNHHKSGDITGYFPHFVESLKSIAPEVEVLRTSAGSSHFNDAGYCLLDDVLESNPDIVVFDWHSTSLDVFEQCLLDSTVAKVTASGAKLVFAIFPRRSCIASYQNRPNIRQVYGMQNSNVYVLNLYDEHVFEDSLDLILRDECHTTPAGGRKYADILLKYILPLVQSSEEGSLNMKVHSPLISVSNIFCPYPDLPVSSIKLLIRPVTNGGRDCSLVLDHRVGPFSPVVDIITSVGHSSVFSLWDPYCHYERQVYSGIAGRFSTEWDSIFSVEIKVSQDKPSYHLSRNTEYDFSSVSRRYMKLRSIYCIGGEIEKSDFVELGG